MLGEVQPGVGASPPVHCLSITQDGFARFHITFLLNHGFFSSTQPPFQADTRQISTLCFSASAADLQIPAGHRAPVIICFHLQVERFGCCCRAEPRSPSPLRSLPWTPRRKGGKTPTHLRANPKCHRTLGVTVSPRRTDGGQVAPCLGARDHPCLGVRATRPTTTTP